MVVAYSRKKIDSSENKYDPVFDENNTYRCLNEIRELCDSLEIDYSFVAIPPVSHLRRGSSFQDIRQDAEVLFQDIEFHLPETVILDDYANNPYGGSDDIHFNDSGHRKFADFILDILTEKQ